MSGRRRCLCHLLPKLVSKFAYQRLTEWREGGILGSSGLRSTQENTLAIRPSKAGSGEN